MFREHPIETNHIGTRIKLRRRKVKDLFIEVFSPDAGNADYCVEAIKRWLEERHLKVGGPAPSKKDRAFRHGDRSDEDLLPVSKTLCHVRVIEVFDVPDEAVDDLVNFQTGRSVNLLVKYRTPWRPPKQKLKLNTKSRPI